jgi:hypothetical protein
MGIVRSALRFPHTRRSHFVSWRRRYSVNANGHLSGDQYPGCDGDLAIYRSLQAGNGTARQHLQSIFHQHRRWRYD